MPHRILSLSALSLVALAAAAGAYASLSGSGPRMGPSTSKTLYEAIDSEMVADELGNIGSVTVRGKKNYYSVDAARFSAWVESRRGRTCTYPGCDAEALLLSERCMKHTGAVTLLGTTFDAERRARMAAAKEFMSRPDVAERYRHDWEKGGPLTLGLFYGREGELKPYFKPETRERHLPKWAKAIAEARGKKVGPAFTKVDADVARRILKAKDEGKSERQIVYIIGSLFDLKLSKTAVHNVIANRAEVIDHFLLHESV
jgi:hypothetical protein